MSEQNERLLYENWHDLPSDTSSPEGMHEFEGDSEFYFPYLLPNDPVYAVKDGKELHLKIITPVKTGAKEKHPLLVFVQGSAWFKQELTINLVSMAPFVQKGYIVAIVEYRESQLKTFPAQICDTKTAVRYLADNAEKYNIDTSGIYLAGDSSGGHTILGCWATWNRPLLDEENTPMLPLKAAVDFYAPTDIVTICKYPSTMNHDLKNSPEGILIGGYSPTLYPELSAKVRIMNYLTDPTGIAPLLIMHGDKDTLVPFHQSVELYEEAKRLNYDVTLYKIKGADHGGSLFYCPQMYETVLEFLNKHK